MAQSNINQFKPSPFLFSQGLTSRAQEELAASSKLVSGIGEKKGCNLKTLAKN